MAILVLIRDGNLLSMVVTWGNPDRDLRLTDEDARPAAQAAAEKIAALAAASG